MSGNLLGFYLSFDCPKCDEELFYGPCYSALDDHQGLPVLPGDLLTQGRVECLECQHTIFLGDYQYSLVPHEPTT